MGTRTGAYALITADSKEQAKARFESGVLRFNRDDTPSAHRRNSLNLDAIEELPPGDPRDRPADEGDLHGLVYVDF